MSYFETAEEILESVWDKWGKSIGTPVILDGEKCSMRLSEVPD